MASPPLRILIERRLSVAVMGGAVPRLVSIALSWPMACVTVVSRSLAGRAGEVEVFFFGLGMTLLSGFEVTGSKGQAPNAPVLLPLPPYRSRVGTSCANSTDGQEKVIEGQDFLMEGQETLLERQEKVLAGVEISLFRAREPPRGTRESPRGTRESLRVWRESPRARRKGPPGIGISLRRA